MESQLQNPEFRNNPENFHPCFPQMHQAPGLDFGKVSESLKVLFLCLKVHMYYLSYSIIEKDNTENICGTQHVLSHLHVQ